jgi:hypothetical protein
MQYKVPQFIEVEDKIFGPLTFKQFLYLAGAGGITLVFVTLLPLWLAIVLAIPFLATGGALAFYRVNDRPLVVVLEHAFNYFTTGKLYLWQHRDVTVQPVPHKKTIAALPQPAKFTESKLRDLAWSLNIKDRLVEGEDEEPRI